jgi:hypothetical protein
MDLEERLELEETSDALVLRAPALSLEQPAVHGLTLRRARLQHF